MNDKVLLRPQEAADQLGISRAMVFRLMQSGALRSIRIGRARRVPVEALRELTKKLAR